MGKHVGPPQIKQSDASFGFLPQGGFTRSFLDVGASYKGLVIRRFSEGCAGSYQFCARRVRKGFRGFREFKV